jgi:hypothetical protein
MKSSKGPGRPRRRCTPLRRRTELLAAFDRSGLTAAAFAREHGIHYTTFCGWRQRRPKTEPSPAFVQVELAEPIAPAELLIDLGAHTRLRLTSARQMDLAVELLRRLNAPAPC